MTRDGGLSTVETSRFGALLRLEKRTWPTHPRPKARTRARQSLGAQPTQQRKGNPLLHMKHPATNPQKRLP